MFILPEGKTGETWELSEIGEYYVEKYLRLVLVLSVEFGPTKGCSNRAKQWDAPDLTMNTDSLHILNCEAEAWSDSHCPGVAVADFWLKQNTHTHSMPLPAQTQSRPILLLCQVLHLPNPSTIFVHFLTCGLPLRACVGYEHDCILIFRNRQCFCVCGCWLHCAVGNATGLAWTWQRTR